MHTEFTDRHRNFFNHGITQSLKVSEVERNGKLKCGFFCENLSIPCEIFSTQTSQTDLKILLAPGMGAVIGVPDGLICCGQVWSRARRMALKFLDVAMAMSSKFVPCPANPFRRLFPKTKPSGTPEPPLRRRFSGRRRLRALPRRPRTPAMKTKCGAR